ncbi:hypothetical protein [Kocuria sp. BT304]|uniref:hypothetical protein n=1 Tax=Kocuria sp. BT304 TaxID=1702043 RepID=UPI000DD3968A|nr:hypothetical protein [Kocuria sp. BT304]
MGAALALIAALFIAFVGAIVFGLRLLRFFLTTKAGWVSMGILLIAGLIYMATHEPIWNKYL